MADLSHRTVIGHVGPSTALFERSLGGKPEAVRVSYMPIRTTPLPLTHAVVACPVGGNGRPQSSCAVLP